MPSSAAVTAAGSKVPLAGLSPTAVRPAAIAPNQLAPTVDAQELRALDLADSPLGSIPLGSIPLGSIPLGSIPLGSIPLGSIPLDIAGGWAALLQGTVLEDIPPQNVTFDELIRLNPPGLSTIPIQALDLSSTPLGSIPLGSIAYATLPLGSIPLGSIGLDWCTDIIEPNLPPGPDQPTCGPGDGIDPANATTTLLALSLHGVPLGSIPLGSIPLGSIPLGSIPLGSIPLGSIDLASSPLGSIPLGSIPLGSIPLGSIPLGSIPLGSIPLGSIPLGSIPLGSIPLGSIPLGSIPLGSIPLGSIPLGSIPLGSIPLGSIPLGSIPLGSIPLGSIPLGSIPLGSIPLGSIDLVVNCAGIDCRSTTLTLAQAPLQPGATLAQLGVYGRTMLRDLVGVPQFNALTLAQLGAYGTATLQDIPATSFGTLTLGQLQVGTLADLLGWPALVDLRLTIAELLALVPEGIRNELTLGGLLQGVVPVADYPWEDLDLAAASRELAGDGGVVSFDIEVDSRLAGASDYALEVVLPAGFRYVEGSLTYDGMIRTTSAAADGARVNAVLEPRAGISTVVVEATVPLDVGAAGRASATLTTTVAGEPLTVTTAGTDQVVTEAFEPNDQPGLATTLDRDTLYLTHVASAGDEDWFAIPVAQGEQLSLILSNLGADFDMALFGPAPARLRGLPDGSLVPVADGGRSLLAEGVVPAVQTLDDVDVVAPAGLGLFGLGANRGTTDERIDTTPLGAGTYFVRVTGYQGATSRQPYALRAAVDAPPLRSRLPGDRSRNATIAAPPAEHGVAHRDHHAVRRRSRPAGDDLRHGGQRARRSRRLHDSGQRPGASGRNGPVRRRGRRCPRRLGHRERPRREHEPGRRSVQPGAFQRRGQRHRCGHRRRRHRPSDGVTRRARGQRRPAPVRPHPRRHRLLQRARLRRRGRRRQQPADIRTGARLCAQRRPLRRRPSDRGRHP